MRLRLILSSACLAGLFVFVTGAEMAAWATPLNVKPEEAFKQAFPQVPAESITPTDIKGLYEVVSGMRIFYYYQEKDYIFRGEILQKDGKSLTAERHGELAAKAAKSLPLEKAVKIGDGKKVVIEITDPDCPFCRTASAYLAKRTDLTRYVFFAALAHPAAINKIHYILGAENKVQAYEEMMSGKEIPQPVPVVAEAVKALAQEHLARVRKLGIQGTPTFFVNGRMVVGADTKKLDQLLKD